MHIYIEWSREKEKEIDLEREQNKEKYKTHLWLQQILSAAFEISLGWSSFSKFGFCYVFYLQVKH